MYLTRPFRVEVKFKRYPDFGGGSYRSYASSSTSLMSTFTHIYCQN